MKKEAKEEKKDAKKEHKHDEKAIKQDIKEDKTEKLAEKEEQKLEQKDVKQTGATAEPLDAAGIGMAQCLFLLQHHTDIYSVPCCGCTTCKGRRDISSHYQHDRTHDQYSR